MRRTAMVLALMALLAVAGVGLVSACGGGSSGGSGSGSIPDTVATVNGVDITGAQVQELITQASVQLKASGQAFPAKGTAQYDEYMAKMVEYLVGNEIIVQSAPKLGVEAGDATVDTQIKGLVKTYGGQKKFDATLKASGMTEDLLRRTIKSQLMSQGVQSVVTKSAKVTDAQVQAYWDAHKAELQQNPDTKTFAKAKESIRTQLLSATQQQIWNTWLSEQTQKLGVTYAEGYDPAVLRADAAKASASPAASPSP